MKSEERTSTKAGNEMKVLLSDPNFFNFVLEVSKAKTEVDVEGLTKAFDDKLVRTRKGDFGKSLKYIPAKYVRERLNDVLGCKWSFLPYAEQRVSNPLQHYNKKDDEYEDSPNYIKVLGILIIPGLGVQMQYGVKATYGFGEANDWKAACTDAFKKCCSAFGIEADYEIEDDSDDDDEPAGDKDIDEALDDIEYDEDELADALDHEISFGKYKELTIEEIYDEDPDYLEWLALNAKKKSDREPALIVLKEKQNKKADKKKGKDKKHSSKSKRDEEEDDDEDEEEEKPVKHNHHKEEKLGKKGSKKSSKEDEDDDDEEDERKELMKTIKGIFDEDDSYDEVTIQSLIESVSTSKKNPNGKSKLKELSVKELKNLADILLEDDDDSDDDEDDDEE
jgi:DNA-directed RNA polymerase subunit delta